MDSGDIKDLVLRAIAVLRERGEAPNADAPNLTILRLEGSPIVYIANVGQSLAAIRSDEVGVTEPSALGAIVAEYLAEVIDLVPAYSGIAAIELADQGAIRIRMR